MAKLKITGWTAAATLWGVPILLTVRARDRRAAAKRLKEAFPELPKWDQSQIQRTTMLPGRYHLDREEYDWEDKDAVQPR